jgi:hypothetical protein
MIFEGDDEVRLTRSELNLLRKRNATNGEAVGDVKTREQLLSAIIGGLSADNARQMLEFVEGLSDQDSGGRHA